MTPEEYEARVEALIAEYRHDQDVSRKRGIFALVSGTVGTLAALVMAPQDEKGEWAVIGGLVGGIAGDYLGHVMWS